MGVMEIARSHLADEGFLVTLCLAQDLGTILRYAEKNTLQLHRSWTLDTDGGYVHPQTQEQVCRVMHNDCKWSSLTLNTYISKMFYLLFAFVASDYRCYYWLVLS